MEGQEDADASVVVVEETCPTSASTVTIAATRTPQKMKQLERQLDISPIEKDMGVPIVRIRKLLVLIL